METSAGDTSESRGCWTEKRYRRVGAAYAHNNPVELLQHGKYPPFLRLQQAVGDKKGAHV